MQGAFLTITIGSQFFLLMGYLFYLLFRTYAASEDRVSLLKWIAGLIGVITLGLVVSIALVASRMVSRDLVVAIAISIVDVVGVYLLIDDTRRISQEPLFVKQS